MKALRASVLSFKKSPVHRGFAQTSTEFDGPVGFDVHNDALDFFSDGGVLVHDSGRIELVNSWEHLRAQCGPAVEVIDCQGQLLMPGFIDTHVHGAQLEVIASYGTQLLDWLERHTFPVETSFEDPAHSAQIASLFVNQLLVNGTTCAAVWPTVHANSVDAFFKAAVNRDMRFICGKVLMDQFCPVGLRDLNVRETEHILRAQIEQWHRPDSRCHYALTPRFAVSTSEPLMQLAGRLFKEYDGLYMQNHLAENQAEIELVKSLYPQDRSYLAVYERLGFCGPRSIFAHGIWLDDHDRSVLQQTKSSIAFCPSSNLFLGSGAFDFESAQAANIPIGLASDVGGGTSLSMLKTMSSAYQVLQLRGCNFNALQAFYSATLGSAVALGLEHKIGRIEPGFDADFIVLDWAIGPLSELRQSRAKTLADKLFALMWLGDDRNLSQTWLNGKAAYERDALQ
jgi:guanine deaminase